MNSETGGNVPARAQDTAAPPQDPAVLDPEAQDPDEDAKLKLQLAIFDVVRRGATGKSLEEIREMLMAAFAARNVAPPPFTWVESAASSAFYGEPYIIDYPTAIAADDLEAAPDETVRKRLADRRKLREVKLPEGILPAPSEWNIPANEVTGGSRGRAGQGAFRAMMPAKGSSRRLLAVAGLAGAVVAALVVAGIARRPSRAAGER